MNQEQGEAAMAVILAVTEAIHERAQEIWGTDDITQWRYRHAAFHWGDLESILDRAEDILIRDTRSY